MRARVDACACLCPYVCVCVYVCPLEKRFVAVAKIPSFCRSTIVVGGCPRCVCHAAVAWWRGISGDSRRHDSQELAVCDACYFLLLCRRCCCCLEFHSACILAALAQFVIFCCVLHRELRSDGTIDCSLLFLDEPFRVRCLLLGRESATTKA